MANLFKDLLGATATLLWPVHREFAVYVLTWAGDAHDLQALQSPTDA